MPYDDGLPRDFDVATRYGRLLAHVEMYLDGTTKKARLREAYQRDRWVARARAVSLVVGMSYDAERRRTA